MRFWLVLAAATAVLAQTDGSKGAANRVIGEVTAKDASANELTVKADSGSTYTVDVAASARCLRVAPGEKDLKNAAQITPADVNVGDRVLARGAPANGGNVLAATLVIDMSKAALAQKHQHEREEWQRRGATGIVKALNPDANEITIATRGREGEQQIRWLQRPKQNFAAMLQTRYDSRMPSRVSCPKFIRATRCAC